jgi:hypothetical protein
MRQSSLSPRSWWIVANTAFGVGIYVGMWHGVEWLGYLTSLLVWIMLACYLGALWTRNRRHRYKVPVHPWIDKVADVFFYAALVASGWIVTAVAYAFSCIVLSAVYRKDAAR